MKPAWILIGLALLLAGIFGVYCLANSSATPIPANTINSSAKIGRVVEPILAPAPPFDTTTPPPATFVINDANATALAENHQEILHGLLTFQTSLEQSLADSTDAKEREALQQELDHLQTQIQFEINSSTTRPVVMTNLGEISLADGHPVQQKLASGDLATFTASNNADGNWSVNVIVRHTQAGGETSDESSSIVVQSGQASVIKATGNEIHFTPKAGSTLSN